MTNQRRSPPPSRPSRRRPGPASKPAGDLAAVRAVERDVLGKRSQLARLHTLLGRLAPEQRREVGAWINATRGRLQERADDLDRGAASRPTGRPGPRPNGSISPSSPAGPCRPPLAALARRSGPSQPGDPDPDRTGGHLRRHGLRGGRGPRGRDRLVQLRGPQHAAGPPGPGHVGHPVPAVGAARDGAVADPHLTGPDPVDGVAAATDLCGHAREVLPARHARRPPPAGLSPDRRAGRRRGHHLRRPGRHHRGLHQGLLRAGHALAAAPVLLPVHRAVGRVRGDLPHLRRGGLPDLQRVRLDRARWVRDGRPQRVRRRRHRPRDATAASPSASASTGWPRCGSACPTCGPCSTTTSVSWPSSRTV